MKKLYRVVYTIATYIETEDEDEVLDIASSLEYDDFAFVDAEYEEVER